jgi:pyrroloquinoline quinone biosynthesis protein B
VVLTNADLDHAAGLLVLREGGAPALYCTERVEFALSEGLRVLPTLAAYGDVRVRRVVPGARYAIEDRDGGATEVHVRAFTVASKPPPYMASRSTSDDHAGDTVGYAITGSSSDDALVYVPGVRDLDAGLAAELSRARCVLIDGTFLTNDELVAMGASSKTARAMGHAPLSGDDGLVRFLDSATRARKVLVHLNNSNPVLREGSDARRWLASHDIEVAHDGLTLDW